MPEHMKSYEEYDITATDARCFSNSTDWEIWQYNVCMGAGNPGRRCVNDDDENDPCPLITLSLMERRPAEWVGEYARYTCAGKVSEAEQKRLSVSKRHEDEAAEKQRVADIHYPMFDVPTANPYRGVEQ